MTLPQDFLRTQDGPVLAKAADLLAFIRNRGHTDVDGMLAAATEAIMRAQIRRSASEQDGAVALLPPPRRQARAVSVALISRSAAVS